MSQKVKDIIFYCVAGLLAITVGIAAILEAVGGSGNLVVSIIAAVAAVALCVLSGLEIYAIAKKEDEVKTCCCCHKEADAKPAVEEVKSTEDVAKASIKKAPAKKSSSNKSTK